MESLPVIFDKLEHIWRDFGLFLLAYPFKILHILGFVLINWALQLSLQVFDWMEVWWLRWPLQKVDFVVTEQFLCGSWGMLWVIVLLESPPTAKSQPSGRGNQIFSQNCLILGGIHFAINPNQCPWTSGVKTATKNDLTHHNISPWVWGTSPCMHLCSYAKQADAEPDKNAQIWSHLSRSPCSSHNANDVKQTPCTCIVVRNGFLLATLPMRLWLWRWRLMVFFKNLVTPRCHQSLHFFHCNPWGFCCFSQYSPQYPGVQDAVASSTQ